MAPPVTWQCYLHLPDVSEQRYPHLTTYSLHLARNNVTWICQIVSGHYPTFQSDAHQCYPLVWRWITQPWSKLPISDMVAYIWLNNYLVFICHNFVKVAIIWPAGYLACAIHQSCKHLAGKQVILSASGRFSSE